MESCVPPGFRFHPTDGELVGYYLRKKVASHKIDLDVIKEIDLYRIEPWDLQGILLNFIHYTYYIVHVLNHVRHSYGSCIAILDNIEIFNRL